MCLLEKKGKARQPLLTARATLYDVSPILEEEHKQQAPPLQYASRSSSPLLSLILTFLMHDEMITTTDKSSLFFLWTHNHPPYTHIHTDTENDTQSIVVG